MDPLRLSEILVSRFSNDIGGLLGNLIGALKLTLESRDPQAEAIAAAVEAGTELDVRLQLIREAWAGSKTELDLPQLGSLTRGLPGAHRLDVDLSGLPESTVLQPRMARVVLNVLLLATESLPRGGVIALAAAGDSDILVTITGVRAAWPAGFAACLIDERAAWAALLDAHAPLGPVVALTARRLAIRVSLLLPFGGVSARRGRRVIAPPLLLSPDEAK